MYPRVDALMVISLKDTLKGTYLKVISSSLSLYIPLPITQRISLILPILEALQLVIGLVSVGSTEGLSVDGLR
jgi:hypothetical protein